MSRFEGLISRLEHCGKNGASIPSNLSIPSQPPAQAAKPTAAPSNAPSSSGFVDAFRAKAYKNWDAFMEVTKEMKNEGLVTAANHYKDMLKNNEAILMTMAHVKYEDNMTKQEALFEFYKNKKAEFVKLGKANRSHMNFFRVFEDSTVLFSWFMLGDEKDLFMEMSGEFFGSIEFPGEKVTDSGPEGKKWMRAFRVVHKDFFEFLKTEFNNGLLKWGEAPEDMVTYYKSVAGGAGSAPASTPVVQQEAEVKKVVAPPKAKAAAPVKKPPMKVLKFKTWEISDYGKEVITFDEDEVQPGMTFNLFNCDQTTVIIKGRCKNIMLSRCKKTILQVDECMATVEVIKCERCQIKPMVKVPTVSIEQSHGIMVIVTKESKFTTAINTTASQSVSLDYPKKEGTFNPNDSEDDDTKVVAIPETWISKIDKETDKVKVVAFEGID